MTGLPWDASYQPGTAPWDIGQPQPAIVRVASEGGFAGTELDAGCGTGEDTLHAASLGLSTPSNRAGLRRASTTTEHRPGSGNQADLHFGTGQPASAQIRGPLRDAVEVLDPPEASAGMDPSESRTDLRCSTWARANSVNPVGTAGCYTGYLLIEWPLPWPRDPSEITELAQLCAEARSSTVRVQLVVPPERSEERRIVHYLWAPESGRYSGWEMVVESDEVVAVARRLLFGDVENASESNERAVLICGHGRRDRCCGSMGVALERGFAELAQGCDIRIARTSHTGGHRFAPTGIVLPEGTAWAYLDVPVLSSVISRNRPVADLIPHYRGCTGMVTPEIQALEAAVLSEIGWSVLDRPRWPGEADSARTVFQLVVGGESTTRWEAGVFPSRMLPVPDCGSEVASNTKMEPEWEVKDLGSV